MRMLCSILLALAASASVADAADYIFTVPVRVENMRFADRVTVTCNVLNLHRPVGYSGEIPVPLTAAAYHGSITINVDLLPGYVRADASLWSCALVYYWHRPAGAPSAGLLDQYVFYQRETGQAIASEVVTASGSLPR